MIKRIYYSHLLLLYNVSFCLLHCRHAGQIFRPVIEAVRYCKNNTVHPMNKQCIISLCNIWCWIFEVCKGVHIHQEDEKQGGIVCCDINGIRGNRIFRCRLPCEMDFSGTFILVTRDITMSAEPLFPFPLSCWFPSSSSFSSDAPFHWPCWLQGSMLLHQH